MTAAAANHASYADAYGAWMRDPAAWWAAEAQGITWDRPWDAVFDPGLGAFGQWFAGASLNTSVNCLDRHVDRRPRRPGRADLGQPGRRPRSGRSPMPTCCDRTEKLAGALAALGVSRGDRVVIYMPMVPDAAVAMLATARAWARCIRSCSAVSPPPNWPTRIADARPKVIISASCGFEPGRVVRYKPLLDAALAMSPHQPDACLILQRPQARGQLDRRPRPRPTRLRSTAPNRIPASRCRPPIRSISCTPPAPPAAPRASCATMAGMPWRCGTPCG